VRILPATTSGQMATRSSYGTCWYTDNASIGGVIYAFRLPWAEAYSLAMHFVECVLPAYRRRCHP
jgi:hypothetical protein